MSTTVESTHSVTEPSDERIRRLAVEAGKYLGREPGDTLPAEEVRRQAEANGYDPDRLLPPGTGEIRIPEQGDLLGELWARAPTPISQFREWLQSQREKQRKEYDDGTYQHPVDHAYSYKAEQAKYGRAKDVGRYFVTEYETFTTVLITYSKPMESGETVAEHADCYYSRSVKKAHRDAIKEADAFEEYAGVRLLAPKQPDAEAPTPTSHGHCMLWLPGFASSDAFASLASRDGIDVSIRYHRSDKVSSPPSVNRQSLERERGPTTALAQEVGANLPLLTAIETFREEVDSDSCDNPAARKATLDASDCPEYVERWCAHMSLGTDGKPDTTGVRRWQPLGRFNEIADSMKAERESDDGEIGPGARTLTEVEREFVEEYVEEVGDYSAERICTFLEANRSEFDGEPDPQAIVPAVRRLLRATP